MTGISDSTPTADELIVGARQGVPDRLGQLLELYRNYLRLLAATQIDRKLRARVSPSDLVQETMLEVLRDFRQFRGRSEAEFMAWIRQILINNMHRLVEKHVLAEKRDVRREISIDRMGASLEQSSARLGAMLEAKGGTPSELVQRQENVVMVADCLARLRPHYREVLILRSFKNLPFEQVSEEMDRSNGAVRLLWLRAIKELSRLYKARAQK